jgi:prepilin-type processing-associated H-X9-DG protein
VVCGAGFERRPRACENKCCSRKCGHELQRINAAPKKAARIVQKLEAKFLRNYTAVVKQIEVEAERKRKAEGLRPCLRCQKMFRNGKDLLCSNECRSLSRKINKKAGKKGRPARGHYDRCRIRGLPFDSSVDRPFVFERDRGVCLLCGEQTRPGDRDKAPTLGHIVPLNNPLNTRHGHTKENTFTNCARCNGRQGNAVMVDGHQNHDDPRRSYLERIRSTGYPLR